MSLFPHFSFSQGTPASVFETSGWLGVLYPILSQPCCPVKHTYFLLLEASFAEVLASHYRVPRTQNQPRSLGPHGIWKWLRSMALGSATCWLADVNQILNTLNSLSSPYIKRDQKSLLQGCCENEMRAGLQNSDNWRGSLLRSGPSCASLC